MNQSPSLFSVGTALLAVLLIWIKYLLKWGVHHHPPFKTVFAVAGGGMGVAIGCEIIGLIFYPPTKDISIYRFHFMVSALAIFWFSIDQLSREFGLLNQKRK